MTIALRNFSEAEVPQILEEWWTNKYSFGLMCDAAIEKAIKIEPFHKGECPPGTLSYGLGAYGYDIRVGYKFKVFTNVYGALVDPKAMKPTAFVDVDVTQDTAHQPLESTQDGKVYCTKCGKELLIGKDVIDPPCPKGKPDHIIIPPNSFALAEAVEYIEVPREILVIGIGKSTYARCGVILNVTPAEPEWRGKLTLEITNSTPLPVKIYAGEGICQLLFFKAPLECLVSYQDKKGKYQDQKGLTLPFVTK